MNKEEIKKTIELRTGQKLGFKTNCGVKNGKLQMKEARSSRHVVQVNLCHEISTAITCELCNSKNECPEEMKMNVAEYNEHISN